MVPITSRLALLWLIFEYRNFTSNNDVVCVLLPFMDYQVSIQSVCIHNTKSSDNIYLGQSLHSCMSFIGIITARVLTTLEKDVYMCVCTYQHYHTFPSLSRMSVFTWYSS